MTSIVLDASVAIPLIRPEAGSAAARRNVDQWVVDRVALFAPAPFWAEVVNALTKGHGLSGGVVIETLFELDQFSITTVEVDRPLLLAGLHLVERSGLTIYDAVYLALARSIGAKLATFDHALIAAASSDAIDLWEGEPGPGHRLAEERPPYGSTERPATWPSWPGAGAYLATLRRQAMSGG